MVNEFEVVPGEAPAATPEPAPEQPPAKAPPLSPTELERTLRLLRERRMRLRAD